MLNSVTYQYDNFTSNNYINLEADDNDEVIFGE